jgi:hypothetical protein
LQKFVFALIFVISVLIAYSTTVNVLKYFVVNNLNGAIYDSTGMYKALDFENDKQINSIKMRDGWEKKVRYISKYNNWAVDLHIGEPTHSRFWFQPIFSIFSIVVFFGVIISSIITTLLPIEYGYFRQKISREIINSLDAIYNTRNGNFLHYEPEGIRAELDEADLKTLYELSSELSMSLDELYTIKNAIEWEKSSLLFKIIHPFKGLNLYLRNHFTEKYSNSILSFVYIGAAFLIIIIGLRGLKFIPASEPSLVFFALGLEFSILITYAITLMFSKPDEQTPVSDGSGTSDKLMISDKQMEKLLRAFSNWKSKSNP